ASVAARPFEGLDVGLELDAFLLRLVLALGPVDHLPINQLEPVFLLITEVPQPAPVHRHMPQALAQFVGVIARVDVSHGLGDIEAYVGLCPRISSCACPQTLFPGYAAGVATQLAIAES